MSSEILKRGRDRARPSKGSIALRRASRSEASTARTPVAWWALSFDGEPMSIEKATFGAGCFWGVEELFRNTKGVASATSGYAGGATENPTYEQVCSHETGHAEVVEIEFDPAQVSYEQLLDIFWSNHNPTTRDRQGPDVGSQYRSVVFYHSPEQKAAAEKKKEELDKSGRFPRPIVTQIEPAPTFYRAEEYHQRYLAKHGRSHCAI